MSNRISKPSSLDISSLFKPGPPLKYIRPNDYPIYKRQTDPNIAPVCKYLELLKSYQAEFSEGSKNVALEKYDSIKLEKMEERNNLLRESRKWAPDNDPNIKGTDPFRTIFVGRLPYETTEVELTKEFSRFGEVERTRVVRDKIAKGNKSRGYGFVIFANPESSKICMRETGVHRGIQINGRTCVVDFERGRTNKYFLPRRFGGGLGGRGYSQQNKMRQSISHGRQPIDHRVSARMASAPSFSQRPSRYSASNFSSHHESSQISSSPPISHTTRYQGEKTHFPSSALAEVEDSAVTQPVVSYRSRTERSRASAPEKKSDAMDY